MVKNLTSNLSCVHLPAKFKSNEKLWLRWSATSLRVFGWSSMLDHILETSENNTWRYCRRNLDFWTLFDDFIRGDGVIDDMPQEDLLITSLRGIYSPRFSVPGHYLVSQTPSSCQNSNQEKNIHYTISISICGTVLILARTVVGSSSFWDFS